MCIVYSVWCGCGPLASAVSAMRSICLWVMECTHTGVWRRHTTMANILPDNNDAKARLTPTLLVQLSSSLSTLSLVFDDVTTQYAFAHHAVCHHYRTNSNANLVVCHQRFICTTNVYAKQPHVVIVMCKRAKLSIFHFIWMLLFIKWNWQQLKNVACRVYSCQRLWSCVTQRANNRHINSIMFICCGSRIDNKTNRIGEFILLLKWVVKRWASHRRRLVISRPTRYAQYGAALLPCSHTNLARRLWQMMDGDNRRTTDSIPRLASYRSRVRWLLYRRAENRLPIKKGNSAICPAIGRNSCTEINRAEIKINRTVLAWIMGIIARQLSW